MHSLNSQKRQPVELNKCFSRRKAPRFDSSAIPDQKKVHLVDGPDVKLINISRGGALVETQERITPGSQVSLRLVAAETVYRLNGRILRCYVYEIDKILTYQCAIAFDEDFTLLPSGKEAD